MMEALEALVEKWREFPNIHATRTTAADELEPIIQRLKEREATLDLMAAQSFDAAEVEQLREERERYREVARLAKGPAAACYRALSGTAGVRCSAVGYDRNHWCGSCLLDEALAALQASSPKEPQKLEPWDPDDPAADGYTVAVMREGDDVAQAEERVGTQSASEARPRTQAGSTARSRVRVPPSSPSPLSVAKDSDIPECPTCGAGPWNDGYTLTDKQANCPDPFHTQPSEEGS